MDIGALKCDAFAYLDRGAPVIETHDHDFFVHAVIRTGLPAGGPRAAIFSLTIASAKRITSTGKGNFPGTKTRLLSILTIRLSQR
jgi:hypothetical protein